MSNSTEGKIALITGTSSGIGLSSAVQLAQQGFTVVATMRDTTKAAPLQKLANEANVTIEIRQLDVEDNHSVTRCIEEVLQTYGRIDLLLNNAGAGFPGSLEQTSLEQLQRMMEINFYGVWRVTQSVFTVMRKAGSGRIITVTSVGGLIGQPFNDAYCAAKFAVEGFMESLAPVAKKLGIAISLIEPGPVNTNFVASALAVMPELTPELQTTYGAMLEAYMGGAQERFAEIGQTPAQVAEVIVAAATSETPHFRYPTSAMIRGLISQKYVDPEGDALIAFFESRLGAG
jgi:NAD(P)-dependent dehydrogenase (short-subunit alcohol dehydrogenase family)